MDFLSFTMQCTSVYPVFRFNRSNIPFSKRNRVNRISLCILRNHTTLFLTDAGSKESEHLSTLLFNMYAKVRDIAVLKKDVDWQDKTPTVTGNS